MGSNPAPATCRQLHKRKRRYSEFNIPTVDLKATGENIVRLRKRAGLSVKDIQEACGFGTPQAVYKWQQGQSLPTVDNLVLLSSLFHVSLDDILIVEMI